MNILAIETTGPFSSVALINENREILGYESSEKTMDHLKGLMPMIEKVLKDAGVKGENLTAVAVSQGPGSFTGIRIGVSTARALAQAWGIRTIAVPSLGQFLYRKEDENLACAMFDARRRQVYGFVEDFLEQGPWMIDDVISTIRDRAFDALKGTEKGITFYGNGAVLHAETLKNEIEALNAESEQKLKYKIASEEYINRDAARVAEYALDMALKGEFLQYGELLPDYMRKAEAEEKLAAGQLPICRGPKQE